MKKANIVYAGLVGLFLVYCAYTIFLASDSLVKRTTKTDGPNGGYTVVTDRGDGTSIVETYVVSDNGSPLSHELKLVSSDPNVEPKIMKKGTFVPKF